MRTLEGSYGATGLCSAVDCCDACMDPRAVLDETIPTNHRHDVCEKQTE